MEAKEEEMNKERNLIILKVLIGIEIFFLTFIMATFPWEEVINAKLGFVYIVLPTGFYFSTLPVCNTKIEYLLKFLTLALVISIYLLSKYLLCRSI